MSTKIAETYDAAARAAYQKLTDPQSPFLGSINGWQVGCVLDTLIDYRRLLKSRGQADAPENARLLRLALGVWSPPDPPPARTLQDEMCWYDDYCWWGIAAAKAWDPAFAFLFTGKAEADFRQIALSCWKIVQSGIATAPIKTQSKPNCPRSGNQYVHRGAPAAWENREGAKTDQDHFFDPTRPKQWAAPRFPGGVWQYDLYYTKRGPCDCSSGPANTDPCDPSIKGLGPFQNTVMNGLYFLFAVRLLAAARDAAVDDPLRDLKDELSTAVESEYTFLQTWFDYHGDQKLPADQTLLQRFGSAALVRERVSTYARITPDAATYPSVYNYDPRNAWAGDQGLVLAGLVDYGRLVKKDQKTARDVALAVLEGVAGHLTKNHVVQAYSEFWSPGDDGDYKSGAGVFWRGLLEAWLVDEDVRGKVGSDYPQVLASSAAATASSAQQDLFDWFNILSTLTAALSMTAPADPSLWDRFRAWLRGLFGRRAS